MAGTRSSARLGSSPQSAKSETGTKRKADDTTPVKQSKRGRPSKNQTTLEESMDVGDGDQAEAKDAKTEDQAMDVDGGEEKVEAKPIEAAQDTETKEGASQETAQEATKNGEEHATKDNEAAVTNGESHASKENGVATTNGDEKTAFDDVKADAREDGKTTAKEESEMTEDNTAEVKGEAVEEDKEREKAMPSNVLEKGIIYFFTRGRVGVEDPGNVTDLQRSFFILRPLPPGAKLTDGAIQDVGNNRLIALPKKVWPKSGKDRFMVFVEKSKASVATLKEEFFQGSDYNTATMGTRHTPEVTPIGEGVYAITISGGGQGTSHLAYMLTIPSEIGQVQQDVGLAEKGSFVISVKNPESGTGNGAAQLQNSAQYPQEIIEEFAGRAWGPAKPKHIDYEGAAVLLIGESFDQVVAAEEDKGKDALETPQEELEKLENEDELRVENLKGDDSIFADLGISSKDYPKVMTTWN